jgi:hypothetical protein
MPEEIIGQLQPDENGYITYQKVVDGLNLTKTELYNRAMDYFVHNYGDVNSYIENRDVVNGIIIGKGVFKKVHVFNEVLQNIIIDTWHVLEVEVKDGRARITITLTNYDEIVRGGELPGNHYLYPISTQYPFNPNSYQKVLYEQAFYKSHLKALETIDSVERALKGDSIKKKNENW